MHQSMSMNVDTGGLLGDLDPDDNLFNALSKAQCKHYTDQTFRDCFTPKHNMDHAFECRIQSIAKKFGSLTNYLHCLDA